MGVRGHVRTQDSMTSVAFVVSCWSFEIITILSILSLYSRNFIMVGKKEKSSSCLLYRYNDGALSFFHLYTEHKACRALSDPLKGLYRRMWCWISVS